MDCQISRLGDVAEVILIGSLDSSWSVYLSDRLDEVVRTGVLDVRVDMAGVSYLSSNGIAFLIRYHRQLRKVGGQFRIVANSVAVSDVLRLTGVAKLLLEEDRASVAHATASAPSTATRELGRVTLQVYREPGTSFGQLELLGDPTRIFQGGFGEADELRWRARPEAVALGLGALGPCFSDCRDRFGEFLAASGVAVYRPSEGSGQPDFEQAASEFVPEVRVLYGLSFTTTEDALSARFEARGEPDHAVVPLSELVEVILSQSQAETVGIVLVAQTDGLVGSALRRSPAALNSETDLFAHPQIRDWLSLTSEPEFRRNTVLVVGVATRSASPRLAPFVRRLSGTAPADLLGHFHAAVVPYRPLPRGPLELSPTIHHLFETGRVETVLHLLGDSRPISGAGESVFTRGVFWSVPLTMEGRRDLS